MYYTVGGFTLDDTVLPSGEVRRAAPGGNALYAAIGARLWGVNVGIVARVGEDYPQEYLDRLSEHGFDLSGVRRVAHPSFHVWILHEGEGQRQIVYRLDSGKNVLLDPTPGELPAISTAITAVHICPIAGSSQAALMEHLLAQEVATFLDLVVVPEQINPAVDQRVELWPRLRAFLPSLEEVTAVWGDQPLPLLLDQLRASAPPLFAVKMGARGSIVHDPSSKQFYHVPAFEQVIVKDTTGAGDAFCGGFMVGLQETGDPLEAALRGTVSASFVIEDFGALHALAVTPQAAVERLRLLRSRVAALKAGAKKVKEQINHE